VKRTIIYGSLIVVRNRSIFRR